MHFGPDIGKASAAADKIFRITDSKSMINPLEDNTKKKIILDTFKGEIEFKDVWFRYPQRKNDWILKGLSLKIEANESVAIVGESGCGKSTIIQLLLRFYDID